MTPAQCRMARSALGIGVRRLAELAVVSTNTITRFEKSDQPTDDPQPVIKPRTIQAIRSALETAGVQFLAEGDVATGPGVALVDYD